MSLEIRLFKRFDGLEELHKILSENYHFTDLADEAEIIITDNKSFLKDNKLNIYLTEKELDYHITISPEIDVNCMFREIRSAIKAYVISPRVGQINFLKEQNELLSEANKGLVELYNLIDNKNHQIEYLKNKLENIINSAGNSIVEINEAGDLLFANKKFIDTTGYGKDIWDRLNFFNLLKPEGRQYLFDSLEDVEEDRAVTLQCEMVKSNGEHISINGYLSILQNGGKHYEIVFEDITGRLKLEKQMKKLEEKAIVAGFSRHLSHNILNALTVAVGFLTKIKKTIELEGRTKHYWDIVEDKFRLVEEIVTGYNDYTNAINLKTRDELELNSFYSELIESIAGKKFEKTFSAFLYNFTELYDINFDFKFEGACLLQGNKHFLKLGLCYIIKDTIRFFNDDLPLHFDVKTGLTGNRFYVKVRVVGVHVEQEVLDTMTAPWNHQMLSQSFDYWGIVIANVISERHGGVMHLNLVEDGVEIIMEF